MKIKISTLPLLAVKKRKWVMLLISISVLILSALPSSLAASTETTETTATTETSTTTTTATTITTATTETSTTAEITTLGPCQPADPTSVLVTAINETQVNVSWVPADCSATGESINYNVTLFDSDSQPVDTSQETAETSVVFMGLSGGTQYTAEVTACARSLCSNSSSGLGYTAPVQPTGLQASAMSISEITLQFTQPGLANSYIVLVDGSNCTNCVSNCNTSCTDGVSIVVGSLPTPGKSYDISVAAQINDVPMESAPATTSSYTIPDTPNYFNSSALSTSEIQFSFYVNGQANSYRVFIHNNNVYQDYTCNPNQCNDKMVTNNLENLNVSGGSYNLTVQTFAGTYPSADSDVIIGITYPPAPGAVTCATSNSTIEILINNPTTDQQYQIDDYMLSYAGQIPASGPIDLTVHFNESGTTQLLTPLISGGTYDIDVISVSNGLANTTISSVSCTTKLNPPSIITVPTAVGNVISVTWMAPIADSYFNLYQGRCSASNVNPSEFTEVYFPPASTPTSGECAGVKPGALYNVTVSTALNDSTLAIPASSNIEQVVAQPTVPSNASATTYSNVIIKVYVVYPGQSTILCTEYIVSVSPTTNPAGPAKNATAPCSTTSDTTTVTVSNLQDDTQYSVRVYAVKNYSAGVINGSTLTGISQSAPVTSAWTWPSPVINLTTSDVSSNSFKVNWVAPTNHANFICYTVQVLYDDGTCYQQLLVSCSGEVSVNCITLNQYYISNCKSNSNTTVTGCSSFSQSVGGLNPSQTYKMNVFAVNPGGAGISSATFQSTGAQSSSNAWIAGVVIGVLVAVIIAIVIAYFVVKQRRNKATNRQPNRPTTTGIPNSVYDEDQDDDISRPPPVSIDDFKANVQELHKDSDYLFSAEFLLLGKMSAKHAQTASELPVNRVKNRFVNILPFDHSRVKLIPTDDDDVEGGTDYINASFMPGYNSRREFIAAQGPMKSTVDDFWRMIWEQNVHIIVMVTNLQEKGREKCALYWPLDQESIFYGDIQVNLISESTLNYYVLRTLEVRVGRKGRKIYQFHYLNFMDFGAPADADEFIEFVHAVQTYESQVSSRNNALSPTIVHCSAGVGRTGTYIVIDHLLNLIKRERKIDIFGIILDMRESRPSMVQSEAQYIFVHECVQLAIERGLHLTRVSNGHTNDAPLIDMGQDAIYMNQIDLQDTPTTAEENNVSTFMPLKRIKSPKKDNGSAVVEKRKSEMTENNSKRNSNVIGARTSQLTQATSSSSNDSRPVTEDSSLIEDNFKRDSGINMV